MSRCIGPWALVLATLLACHPRAASDGPGSHRGRAQRGAGDGDGAVIDLVAARHRTCAVLAGGELRCWGDNQHGNLGDGTQRTRRYPHPVQGIDDAEQVAVGPVHTCARHRDGRVSCWGRGTSGQLGDGSREDRHTPVEVGGLRDVIDVGVGFEHSCAVRSDGSTWCWGNGERGALGDGTSTTRLEPAQVKGLGRARRVLLGDGSTCAWLRDDSVWCWGSDPERYSGRFDAQPQGPLPLPPVVDVAMGPSHACAVTRAGEVRCWGRTYTCEHGVSQLDPVRVPQVLGSLPPVAAMAGPQCARARSGELLCWGLDPAGAGSLDDEYGYDGTSIACTTQRVLPELTRRVTRISAHDTGGCGVLDDESLWCWGDGGSGELGDGSEVSHPKGVEVVALREPPALPGPTPLQVLTSALVAAGAPASGFALVWHDAALYASATASSSVGRIADFAEEQRGDPYAGVLPVRIIAVHGERVEVEPLGPSAAAGHCGARTWVGFDRYALHMFVRLVDLAPVIGREYAMGYPDGSGLTLGAGVLLRPLEAGVVVRLGSLTLPLELTQGDAALAYAAPGLTSPDARAPWWELPALAAQAHLTLDDRRVYVGELPDRLDLVQWVRPEQEAGVVRIHVEDGCAALDMIADDPVPTRGGGGGGGAAAIGGLGGYETVTFTRVRQGAPAYWEGGARAGEARISYRTREQPKVDGPRRCFTLTGDLRACHDATDLSEEIGEVSRWSEDG